MALTGHTVLEKSCRLEGLELKRYESVGVKLKGLFSRTSDTGSIEATEALWLELWIEEPPKFPKLGGSISVGSPDCPVSSTSEGPRNRRLNRQANLGQEVPRGRVIVYCKRRIFIIPCELTWSWCPSRKVHGRAQVSNR